MTALRFRSHQDALDFGRHSAENVNRRLLAQKINISESYEKADLEIVLQVTSRRDARKWNLVFFAVVGGVQKRNTQRNSYIADQRGSAANRHRNESCVLGVSKLVQGPDGVIPSLVRLERAKKRKNFVRQILGNLAIDKIIKPNRVVSNGKLSFLGSDLSSGDGAGVTNLIKSRAQPLQYFSSGMSSTFRRFFDEFQLVNLCDAIGIQLNDLTAWVWFKEPIDSLFKAPKVLICPFQSSFWAVEWVTRDSHDKQTRSDKRPRVSKSGAALSQYTAAAAQAAAQEDEEEGR